MSKKSIILRGLLLVFDHVYSYMSQYLLQYGVEINPIANGIGLNNTMILRYVIYILLAYFIIFKKIRVLKRPVYISMLFTSYWNVVHIYNLLSILK